MTQPRSEPDGSRGPVPLEQIRESEQARPARNEVSSAGRTEPTVAKDGTDSAEGDSAPRWMTQPVDQGSGPARLGNETGAEAGAEKGTEGRGGSREARDR